MLKAIARADKERAIEVEESNDTTGYRTLSCVLMESTISRASLNTVASTWRDTIAGDNSLSHCTSTVTLAHVLLLVQLTFRCSAPMLTWQLEVPPA